MAAWRNNISHNLSCHLSSSLLFSPPDFFIVSREYCSSLDLLCQHHPRSWRLQSAVWTKYRSPWNVSESTRFPVVLTLLFCFLANSHPIFPIVFLWRPSKIFDSSQHGDDDTHRAWSLFVSTNIYKNLSGLIWKLISCCCWRLKCINKYQNKISYVSYQTIQKHGQIPAKNI